MISDEYILITGSAGLLGSRLIEYIIENKNLQKDDDGFYKGIIGIDALEDWGNNNIIQGVRNYKIDLSLIDAPEELDDIFNTYNIQYVYHFASYAAEGLSFFMRNFNYKHNIIATANIINTCIKHNIKKLIYTSSMSVYGDCFPPYFEWQRPSPCDPYAIAKTACEYDIRMAGKQFGLNWTILRPHNVFGRNQNMNDTYRNVIGIWMHQIREGKPITIYGDGEQTRNFTEMTNILDPLYRCAYDSNTDNEIINLGGLENKTLNQIADIVLNITKTTDKVYLEPRKEIKKCSVDPGKSIRLLNYQDNISIEEGIQNMWDWYKEKPLENWYKWDTFELDNGVYEYWK